MSKFKFYCPINIEKAKDEEGQNILKLGGIASTYDEDSDGEFLDPAGFELQDFLDYGMINWHHQAKDKPSTIIGEPTVAEIRKDGLYVECELYADSSVAREVYDLAEVMNKNSKRRKLGFSIEGSVIEKDPANSKIIKKAVITGLAITHMPKNPKTFADIIKGKTDTFEKDNEEDIDKSMEAESESGRAVTHESVNYKIKDLTEEKMFDEIFKAHPDLDVEKAQKIYNLLNLTRETMGKKSIGSAELSKAMGVLGFGADLEGNPFLEKSTTKNKKSPEEVAKIVQDELFKDEEDLTKAKGEEEDLTKAKPAEEKENLEKANVTGKGEFLLIKKVLEKGFKDQSEISKAVGVILKSNLEITNQLTEQVETLTKANEAQELVIGEMREGIEKANRRIGQLGGISTGRKSITKGFTEKESFNKAKEDEGNAGKPTLSKSRDYAKVLDIVDKFCDAKGMRADLSKAVMSFESTRILPQEIANEIQSELGVTIVD